MEEIGCDAAQAADTAQSLNSPAEIFGKVFWHRRRTNSCASRAGEAGSADLAHAKLIGAVRRVTLDVHAARTSLSWASRARASRRSSAACRGSSSRPGARSSSTARTCSRRRRTSSSRSDVTDGHGVPALRAAAASDCAREHRLPAFGAGHRPQVARSAGAKND